MSFVLYPHFIPTKSFDRSHKLDVTMPPSKSIFRGPEAQHFQLVHRSQRDPLINDPDASQRVLKPVDRANDRKLKLHPVCPHRSLAVIPDAMQGVTLADLEATVDKTALRENEGEAALYGVAYDDSSYDYMAHLKPIGSGAGNSVLIPGPRGSGVTKGMKGDRKGKGKAELPEELFASEKELSLDEVYSRAEQVPRELQGLQPDMDPHLRQVLEALEDDAFVNEEDGDGWFEELVKGGEGPGEEWKFREEGFDEDRQGEDDAAHAEASWQGRFKAFKAEQEADNASETADTVGSLAEGLSDMMVLGGKKRRGKRGPSDASGMSMSSSSMFRSDGLRTLDERFDKVGVE